MNIHLRNGTIIYADKITFNNVFSKRSLNWLVFGTCEEGEILISSIDFIMDRQTEDNLQQQD